MPYTLIQGEFHIFYPDIPRQGPEPDGDTLKFKPDNPTLVEGLWRDGVPRPDFNNRGMINLRFEGLDALETHFDRKHQNLSLARQSRDFLLDETGFENVVFWDDLPNKVKSVTNHPRRGFILSNGLDGHGRIVAFLFFGSPPEEDGAQVFLSPEFVDQSFNAASLRQGESYPLFYLTLPKPLKDHLASIAKTARQAGTGLYSEDVSSSGEVFLVTPDNFQEIAIWPKLFRRLVRYFAGGFQDLTELQDWIRRDPRDRDDRMLLPDDYDAHFHNILDIRTPTEMRLSVDPADIVILPDDFVMPDTNR